MSALKYRSFLRDCPSDPHTPLPSAKDDPPKLTLNSTAYWMSRSTVRGGVPTPVDVGLSVAIRLLSSVIEPPVVGHCAKSICASYSSVILPGSGADQVLPRVSSVVQLIRPASNLSPRNTGQARRLGFVLENFTRSISDH